MAAISYDKTLIRPYTDVGEVYPPLEAGEVMELGNAVILQSDRTVDLTAADDAEPWGLVVSQVVGFPHPTGDVAEGDKVGTLRKGLVSGFADLTPGAGIFLGADGVLQDSGTVQIGIAFSDTIADFDFTSPVITGP